MNVTIPFSNATTRYNGRAARYSTGCSRCYWKSRQAVGFYANGTSSPDWETIAHLAQYFNVSADWLLGLSEFTNPKTANLSVEDVGLSEQATTTLAEYTKSGNSIDEKKKQAINLLLKDDSLKEWGNQLLLNLSRYLFQSLSLKKHYTSPPKE